MIKFFKDYLVSPTHKWWVDNVWKPSWTRFVSAVYGIPAALVSIFQAVAMFAKDDTVNQYLAQMHVPNYVPMALAGVALVYYVAHGRD